MDTGRSSKMTDPDEVLKARINGDGAVLGIVPANPTQCMDCLNANGEPPWEDKPTKRYCMAYLRSEGAIKPPSVYYDGGPCEFRRPKR